MKLLKRLRNLWAISAYEPGYFFRTSYQADLSSKEASRIEPGDVAVIQARKPIKRPGMAVIIKSREKDPIDELVEQLNQE